MPRNRALRGAKNSRSDERGCSSVHPPPNRRRMGRGSNPAPPPTGYAAQSRFARCKNSRSDERGCSSVPPPPKRRRMGGGNNPAPPPTGYAAQSREARCKNSRSAERGCSSVHPPPNRRRRGGGSNLALALGRGTNPCPTASSLSPHQVTLSHTITQPHTKRRASHAD